MGTEKTCVALFNATEPFEEEWGADLCTQSAEVLQPMVDSIIGVREYSAVTRLTVLRKYVEWCREVAEIPSTQDGINRVKINGIERMENETVTGPDELERFLNKICHPAELKTTDNLTRAFFWLAFSGIDREDVERITIHDVDINRMCIHIDRDDYPIYSQAVPALRNCVEQKDFLLIHPNYKTPEESWLERVDGDLLLRGSKGSVAIKSIVTDASRKCSKALSEGRIKKKLSYRRVWMSGYFYRVYERERMGFEPTFEGLSLKLARKKNLKTDKNHSFQSRVNKINKQYLTDYYRWKIAHEL